MRAVSGVALIRPHIFVPTQCKQAQPPMILIRCYTRMKVDMEDFGLICMTSYRL